MFNNIIFFLILILLLNLLTTINSSLLAYELQILEPKNKIESLLSFNSTYTTLEMGTPPQKVNFYFTLEHHQVSLTNKNCQPSNLFYPAKSSTFQPPFTIERKDNTNNFRYVYVDKLNVKGSNINNFDDLKLNEFPFLSLKKFNITGSTSFCGNIGIEIMQYSLYEPLDKNLRKIYNELNHLGIEKDDDFSFFNYNEKDYLIYGIMLHNQFPQHFKDIKSVEWLHPSIRSNSFDVFWEFSMKEIYYNDVHSNPNEFIIFEINPLFELIIGTNEFKDNIIRDYFKEYINKGICSIQNYKHDNSYSIIECNKDQFGINDIQKFPIINLSNIGLQYTFVFKGEELFLELNNKWYFEIIFPEKDFDPIKWVVGRIFLRKYPVTFSPTNRLLGFYINKEKSDKGKKGDEQKDQKANNQLGDNSNKNIGGYIKIIIIALIFTLVGILIGRKIFKMRKQRANELMDDLYQYDSEEKDIKNKNLNSSANIELNSKLGIR